MYDQSHTKRLGIQTLNKNLVIDEWDTIGTSQGTQNDYWPKKILDLTINDDYPCMWPEKYQKHIRVKKFDLQPNRVGITYEGK